MDHRTTFLKYLAFEKKYSDHTVQSYRRDLDQFALYLSTHIGVGDLAIASYPHIRSWIVHLMSHDYQPRSVNRKISVLRSFYKHLLRQSFITIDPMQRIKALKLPKRLPKALPKEVIIKALEDESKPSFEEARDVLIIDMLYSMGLRRSELLGITIQSIDNADLRIKVLGKGNKERLVPITEQLHQRIVSYMSMRGDLDTHSDALFVNTEGDALSVRKLYSIVVDHLSKYTTADARSPHVLRHSFATHMADGGADLNAVKDIMGHASLASTEVYLHSTVERLRKAYTGAHPRA